MNNDDDKFPVLVSCRPRSRNLGVSLTSPLNLKHLTGPAGNPQLSASSAALDLAPLSQTPAQAGRNFGPGARASGGEWPQFQGQAGEGTPTTTSQPTTSTSSLERHRSITNETSSPIGSGTRGSPGPRAGAGQLPPPRSALGGVGGSPSGRSSPVVEKKLGGLDGGLGKVNGFGGVDAITDQFSNVRFVYKLRAYLRADISLFSQFNIDTNAFGNDPSSGPFGGYVHDHGAFVYDGNAGAYGSMGANRFAGLRLEDLQGGEALSRLVVESKTHSLTLLLLSQTCSLSARTSSAAATCRRSSRTATPSTAT